MKTKKYICYSKIIVLHICAKPKRNTMVLILKKVSNNKFLVNNIDLSFGQDSVSKILIENDKIISEESGVA